MFKMAKQWEMGLVPAVLLLFAIITIDEVSVESARTGSTAHVVEAVINAGPVGRTVQGTILFIQGCPNGHVHITGTITGLKANTRHGFHIHQTGDLRGSTNPCKSTGGHYNPLTKSHGAPEEEIRHVGDLGNIQSDADGRATIDITDRMVKLCGRYSVIGRAVVIHELADDLGKGGGDSKKTGNAGGRAGCGVIARAKEWYSVKSRYNVQTNNGFTRYNALGPLLRRDNSVIRNA